MTLLPEKVIKAWNRNEGPAVLATVDAQGVPNIIYASSINVFGDACVAVDDHHFHKSRLEDHTERELFDFMKTWNPAKHPGHAIAVLRVEECYSGAERI